MKNTFLANLLVVFALGLCGLCTFQWLRETQNRKEVQNLHNDVFQLKSWNQDHTNRIAKMDVHIAELTDSNALLGTVVKSNQGLVRSLMNLTNSLSYTNELLGKTLDVYTNAFNQTTGRLAEAYANIKKQNDVLKEVVAQRDDYVSRLNVQISNYNNLVKEHNEAVKRVGELQDQLAALAAQQEKKKQ